MEVLLDSNNDSGNVEKIQGIFSVSPLQFNTVMLRKCACHPIFALKLEFAMATPMDILYSAKGERS
jgi:hypothetical protein